MNHYKCVEVKTKMGEKKSKCPLCNKKLVMVNGVPTCPDCGYKDPYGTSQPQSQTTGYGGQPVQTGYGGQPGQTSYGGQPVQTGYGSQPAGTSSTGSKGTGGKSNTGAMAAIIAVVVIVLVVVVGLTSAFLLMRNFAPGTNAPDRENIMASSTPQSADRQEQESQASASRQDNDISHLTFTPPESPLLQELVSVIFDKPAGSVTKSDLNSVVGLKFYELGDTGVQAVDYCLSDDSCGSCVFSEGNLQTEDLKCFPNLESLYIDGSLDWGTDWHGLTSLSVLSCGSTIEELTGIMDVSQLTAMELDCNFMMTDFTGIENFTNLEYLSVDGRSDLQSLDGLSGAPALKIFILESGDMVEDFEELYSMSRLQGLSIDSGKLRDIGFIRSMPELEYLGLRNTDLKGLDALADCADTLKGLHLYRNYSVDDYSVVFQCTGLEELELCVYYDTNIGYSELPDLSGLTNLKTLILGNFDRLDTLKKLTWLENLTLSDTYVADETALEGLVNLQSLSLNDMSLEPSFLKPVSGLTGITTVDLKDSFIWGDISPILSLPGLQYLNMESVDFGLNLDAVPVCESLTVLNMTDTTLHRLEEDGSWPYFADDDEISLSDNTEFLERFPNLVELYVPGHELEDVEFAAQMEQLMLLDISDNYVTSLTPLSELKQLRIVICKDNPIHDRTGIKDAVLIE